MSRSSSRVGRTGLIGVVLWLALCTVALGWVLIDGPREMYVVYALTAISLILGGAAILFDLLVANRDVFGILPWSVGFFLLIFPLRTVVVLIGGSPYLGDAPFDRATREALELALLYVNVGLVVFLAAFYSSAGVVLASSVRALPKRWNLKRGRSRILALLVVGLFGNVALIGNLGGLTHYLLNKQEVLVTGMSGNYYIALFASMTLHAWLISYVFSLTRQRFRVLTWLVLFPLNCVLGLASGSKGAFLSLFLMALMFHHYLRKPIRIALVGVFIVLAMAAFPLFNAYRGDFQDWSELASRVTIIAEDVHSDWGKLMQHVLRRFAGTDMFTLIVRDTPGSMDFQFGRTLAPIAVAWIPRGFWSGKPTVSFGRTFAVAYLHSETEAAAPTLLGEAYVDFHAVGVVLMALLMGVLCRALYHYGVVRGIGESGVYAYVLLFEGLFRAWEWNIPGWVTGFLPSLATVVAVGVWMGSGTPRVKRRRDAPSLASNDGIVRSLDAGRLV